MSKNKKTMKITGKYIRMSEIYKRFANDWQGLDFSQEALEQMYLHDSNGTVKFNISETKNGYFIGKYWMSVTINMWKEDIKKGLLLVNELLEGEDAFPEWFIKKIGLLEYRINFSIDKQIINSYV